MEQFFVYEDQLPANAGYDYFSIEHFLCITIFLLLLLLFCKICREGNQSRKVRLLKIIAVSNIILELVKNLILFVTGTMNIYELPLHICSLALFVCLINAFAKSPGIKTFTGEVATVFLLPAACMAVIFPDYHEYPVLSFMNIYGYLGHFLVVSYVVLLLISPKHGYRGLRSVSFFPDIRHIFMVILYIIVTAIPIYLFDLYYDVNYYFVNWPLSETPLRFLEEWFGEKGYKYAFIILLILMSCFMYMIYWVIDILKHRRVEARVDIDKRVIK